MHCVNCHNPTNTGDVCTDCVGARPIPNEPCEPAPITMADVARWDGVEPDTDDMIDFASFLIWKLEIEPALMENLSE